MTSECCPTTFPVGFRPEEILSKGIMSWIPAGMGEATATVLRRSKGIELRLSNTRKEASWRPYFGQ